MCAQDKIAYACPELVLADLMSGHLDVFVSPLELKRLITTKWSAVSTLAHAIHDNDATRILRERRDALLAEVAAIEKQIGGA